MADRKAFLLRVDAGVLEAVQRWANDDLRSLNGQIEYLLRDALRRAGRPPRAESPARRENRGPGDRDSVDRRGGPSGPPDEAGPPDQ